MKQLLKLLALNKTAARRFEVVKAEAASEATIYLYDAIVATDEEAAWWGGVSAQSFVKEIRALEAEVIHLRINSPGGDVFAARAMEQALREHKARVITHVDGFAASAASYLALAGDEVEIAAGGFFMIHKAWTFAYGNADDLISTAELLTKIDDSLVATYATETGQEADQLREWMRAETWFNSDEAVQYGFADRVAASAVKDTAAWDLSAYAHAPKMQRPAAPAGRATARQPALQPLNMAEQDFLTAMIDHHGAAIQMSRDLIKADPQAPLREFCEGIITAQAGEVELMNLWLEVGVETDGPGSGDMSAMASNTTNTADLLRRLELVEKTA